MEAIQTFYDGKHFRSRLEARWAMFFKLSNIRYEYEPEGFKNGNEMYLPDFYLPDVYLRNEKKGIYIEIKRLSYNTDDFKPSGWFTKQICLFAGTPDMFIFSSGDYEEGGYQIFPYWDNYMSFYQCNCGMTKIEFQEGNYHECHLCNCKNDNLHSLYNNSILATQYRF